MLALKSISAYHLTDISLTTGAGECIGLTGASGSGKTMLLRVMADLEPFAGALHLEGRPHTAYAPWEWRRRVGMLPATSQWWHDRVDGHFPNIPSEGTRRLGLPADIYQWPVSRLSSGERQRLAVLRLLENRPSVLLLDEPAANLDTHHTRLLEDLISDYRRSAGAAVIWVTHNSDQIRRITDRCFEIRNGKLFTVG